jgi:pimeloyl-ACP methyl ester carboxylesterase
VPSGGALTAVPVLMLNGDIDLQSPLESARRAQAHWPNSVFLTVADAPHVTVLTSDCAVVTAVSFLANPVLPDPRSCDGEAVALRRAPR